MPCGQWLMVMCVSCCSAKDGLVKLWDLDTQHCFQTIVSHHKEVWSLELVGGVSQGGGVVSLPRLVTATGDNKVRVFQLSLLAAGVGEEAAEQVIHPHSKQQICASRVHSPPPPTHCPVHVSMHSLVLTHRSMLPWQPTLEQSTSCGMSCACMFVDM